MNRFMAAARSAAKLPLVAAVAIGIVSACATAGPGPTPNPTPNPTAAPSAAPSPASSAPSQAASQLTEGDVEPGRHFHEIDGYRYTFTVPESGWSFSVDAGGVYQGDDSELAVFWPGGDMSDLYRRACNSTGTEFDPGPSVDDLADGLASLEDFETTSPADVTVSGFEGKRVAVTVPMDVDVRSSTCDGSEYSLSPNRWFQAPGQTDDMYILDLGGERQITVVSNTPSTPADVTEQLEEMLASLVIEPL